MSEQRAIAEVLGALDDKIAANGDLAENCEALAQHLARRTSVLSPLHELATHRKSTVTPAAMSDPQVSHYSLPAYDDRTVPEQVAPATIKSNKYEIQTPAVLVSRLNPRFPRFWNVPTLGGSPALASTEFMVLEPIRGSSSVLWAALSQPSFSDALRGKVAGTSGSHQRVRPTDLLETPVIDTREIDDHEAETITTLVARGDAARNESLTLAATRDALLPALMSGKLRVKDAERQVEAVV